jgi:toxin ParE1/3/4
MRVVWTRPARRHLDEIAAFIREDDPAAAAKVVSRVLDRADTLSNHPHLGRPGRIEGTRELFIPSTPYLVAYRVREGEVEILAVFHGARRWPDHL